MARILSVFNLLKRVGFAVLLLGNDAHAQDSLGVSLISTLEYWTGAYDLEMVGDTLYAVSPASALYIMDLSDPTNPVEIGRCPWYDYGDVGGGVDVVGDLAYVGVGYGGLVFDISVPTQPIRIAGWEDPGGTADLMVFGDYAVRNSGNEGFPAVLDVSDVNNIHLANGFPGIMSETWPVGVVGDYLFMLGYGLRVFNMIDPFAPELVAHMDTSFSGREGVISGDYLYFATLSAEGADTGGVRVIDISNPLAPVEVGSCDDGRCGDITVTGDLLVVSRFDSLNIWDISTPASPVFQGTFRNEGDSEFSSFTGPDSRLASFGNIVCANQQFLDSAVAVIDVSSPEAPVLASSVGRSAWVEGIEVVGNVGFLSGAGLRTVDYSDPANVFELGASHLVWPSGISDVAVVRGYAYTIMDNFGLVLFDVRDPATPESLRTGPPSTAEAYDVVVSGDFAYVSSDSLVTLNVSNPVNPSIASVIDYDGLSVSQVSDGFLYGMIGRTLYVYSLEDPTMPSLVGEVTLPSGFGWIVADLAVSGDYAFVAYGNGGLRVIDISDPTNPHEITLFSGVALRVAAQGNTVIFYSGRENLNVYDVTDPLNAELVGYYEVEEWIDDMDIVENKLLTVSGSRLRVYDVDALISEATSPHVVPDRFELHQNYPNPFNATTEIRFDMPQAAHAELKVFNIRGQVVATLVDEVVAAGVHQVSWNGKNAFGQTVASGVYIYSLQTTSFQDSRKMLLIK